MVIEASIQKKTRIFFFFGVILFCGFGLLCTLQQSTGLYFYPLTTLHVFPKCTSLKSFKYIWASFLVIPRKFALYNQFQWRNLKEGMTQNFTHILISVGCSLLHKRINQQHLYHRFFALLRFSYFRKKFLPYIRENQIFSKS